MELPKKEIEKTSNTTVLMVYLCFIIAIVGSVFLTKKDNEKFSTLPILGLVTPVSITSNPDSLKHIYALLAFSTSVFQDIKSVDLDQAFFIQEKPPVQIVEKSHVQKVVPIDYNQNFKNSISFDGITNNGIIINGALYGVGDDMEDFSQRTSTGKLIFVPELVEIKGSFVYFRNKLNRKSKTIVLQYVQN